MQTPANKACTGRWGFCGIFKHFSGFGFFLLPSRVHARPHAGNANRWANPMGKLVPFQQEWLHGSIRSRKEHKGYYEN